MALEHDIRSQREELKVLRDLCTSMNERFGAFVSRLALPADGTSIVDLAQVQERVDRLEARAQPELSVARIHTLESEPQAASANTEVASKVLTTATPEQLTIIVATQGQKRKRQDGYPNRRLQSPLSSPEPRMRVPSPEPMTSPRMKYARTSHGESLENGMGSLGVSGSSARRRGSGLKPTTRGRGRIRGRFRGGGAPSEMLEPVNEQTSEPTLNIPEPMEATARHAHADVFAFIRDMNCMSERDLQRLKAYVVGDVPYEFPLFGRKTEGGGRVQLFLKMGGKMSNTIRVGPRDGTLADDATVLQPKDTATATSTNIFECWLSGKGVPDDNGIPDYFVPLGEVYAHTRPRGGDSRTGLDKIASTNYFMFMDICSPARSLWLIYRYEQYPSAKNEHAVKKVPLREPACAVFTNTRVFDIVRVLNHIGKWEAWDKGVLDDDQFKEVVGQGGRVEMMPLFTAPLLVQVEETLKKKWKMDWIGL
ncbi:hypothetical protein B0H67DRAFT_555884 [Lasiosphaeris hirsuta]|uniref:Uncharacterized protein n=1 Tax=Lasiosphaeris hirsuta TaxID=260670 RepID=A0AA40AA20_9PEZI|nr:hypothetical protein B0H67DRAFT_555884 [Lasiosphaeris hirsuta]